MKGKFPALAKRSLAFALALALLLTLCPALPLTAEAAEWVTGSKYHFLQGAFETADSDLVYEGDQPYDWAVTVTQTQGNYLVDVRVTVTDADGNIVGGEPVILDDVAANSGTSVMCSAADYPALTTDLVGTFTMVCDIYSSNRVTAYAKMTETFSRVPAGAEVETTAGTEVEPTEATEATEPTDEVFTFTDGWTYKPNNEWINGYLTSKDADLVFEDDQAYDWDVCIHPTRDPQIYDITVEADIKDADGNVVSSIEPKAYTFTPKQANQLLTAAEFTELTTDLAGDFTLTCTLKIGTTTYAQLVKTFSRVTDGSAGEGGEGGETPDEPVTPPDVPGSSVTTAYVRTDMNEIASDNMTLSFYNWREGEVGPQNIGISTYSGFYYWDYGSGISMNATLSDAFLEGFDGNVIINVSYITAGPANVSLVYHSTSGTETIYPDSITVSTETPFKIKTATFTLSDAVLTNTYGLGYSFALLVNRDRFRVTSVEVSKPSNEPGNTYTLDLNSEVVDLVFLDETPYDLSLNAATDGAMEEVTVSYTLSGGNLAEALTGSKTLYISKDGTNVLDAAWFTEKANGFGDFTLEVTMENAEKVLATKTFSFSRKMTSILSSELTSATAENKDGVLVFGEDAAMDLELYLKNKLSEVFNGSITYTVSYNGAAVEGFENRTKAIEELFGDAVKVNLALPDTTGYGIYELAITVNNDEGTEVHNKVFTFARQKTEFVNAALSSATYPDLVFVDDAPFDMAFNLWKTDGYAEQLNVSWGLFKGEELIKSGKFPKEVNTTETSVGGLDWTIAAGYGSFTMKLKITNSLGYVQEIELPFSRIESVKMELISESNPDLIFAENEIFDLDLSLTQQSGEEGVYTLTYSVVSDGVTFKTLTIGDVNVTAEGSILPLGLADVTATGTYTITVNLVDAEGNTVKTAEFQVSRIPAMTADLVYPSAQIIDGVVTYLDMVPYDIGLSLQKQAGTAEKLTVNYTVTDAEGNELVSNSISGNVGSDAAVTAPLDLSLVSGNGTFHLDITVTDAAGIEVAAAELDFARVEYITSVLASATNSDLVFTEGEAFDLGLGIYNSNPAGVEPLKVTYTITGDGLEEPIVFPVTNLNAAKFETYINQHTSLENLAATGTFTLTLQIGVGTVLRHEATYTFSRVALVGSLNSDIQSASSPSLVFAPGGNIDMKLYVEKTDEVAEGFDTLLTVTDAEGNEKLRNEANIRPFLTKSFVLTDLVDLSQITEPGVYSINLTLTDNSGNVRHTNSVNFTLVALEGSVELQVGSTTNSDLIYTEGEEFDLGLIMKKTDGIPEAFKAYITITDKAGNVVKEREANVPAVTELKTSISNLIDLSDLPATGSFSLNIVMVDAAGNERLNSSTAFHRVKKASVKTQVSSNTNKDMIFIDGDVVDLNVYVQKTDGVPEKLTVQYVVYDPNGNVIAEAGGDTNVAAEPSYFKTDIELPELPHGTYKVKLTVTDNSGIVRSDTETKFIRISGADIKHQVSGSSTGTKMQFTPGMTIDLCLFVQKLDGVPESLPGELYVTSPSGQVILTLKGNLNVKAQGYSKYPLDLNGKCNEFGTYKVSYIIRDDAGNVRVSSAAYFKVISPSGELAVAVKSESDEYPGLIYGKDDAFDLVLYVQKADGVEQTVQIRYTISDMNGLVLETKQGKLALSATGYKKIPIELPDIEAFQKYGIFSMKVEIAGPTGEMLFTETYSFSRVLTPEKQLDVMGVCTHLAKKGMTGTQAQQYVELARQAGASFWRDELPWSTVESSKGTYKIPAVADSAVNYTLSIGLEPLFILDYGNSNYGSDVTTEEWMEGWLGYVEYVVTHFKGRIKYYEVWNEWNIGIGGLDKKYRDYPELYANLLVKTYKLIKEIDPEITVIGGVVAGGEEEWTEGFLKCEGAAESMDVFSFHCYADNDVREIQEQAEIVRELLDKYGREDIPMWLTETGWPTHIGRSSFSEEVSAGNLVSLYTWAMANPDILDQIFWYDLHNDGVERENAEHNFGLLANWDVDENPVPMAAKRSYVAMSAMNAILVGAECVGEYDLGQKGITAYHFKKDGKDLLVAWADDDALNMIATVGENNIIVTDMYGNASALTPVDGKVSLFFSDAPIYIEYDLTNKLEMVEGGFELDKLEYSVTPAVTFPVQITRNNGLETYSGSYAFSVPDGWSIEGIEFGPAAEGATEIVDTVYITVSDDAPKGKSTLSVRVVSGTNVMGQFTVPIEMGDICTVNPDVVFTEDGAEFKLSVEVQNAQSNKPLKGTINLLAPENLLSEASSIPFEVPAGENKAVLLDMPEEVANNFYEVKLEVVLDSGAKHEVSKPVSFLYAIKAPENMNLDGVIDEQWDGAMEFSMGEDEWLNTTDSDAEWPGNTAKGYAMWDDEYLYVAIEAYDESHYQNGTGTSIWMGDSVQMSTDINRYYVPGELGYNEIGFSLSSVDSAIENWNWNASPGKNVSKGGIFKIVRNEETQTTVYEVALPWNELLPNGVEFKDYNQKNIGFSLLVNENSIDEDGEPTGRTGWIEYMSGIGYRKDATKFGDLILVELPEK